MNRHKLQTLKLRMKSWFNHWPELGTIIFTFLALEAAILSIEQAQWIKPQPSLTATLALAVVITWLLSWSRIPVWATCPAALAIGALFTVWQAQDLLAPSNVVSGTNQLVSALKSWWQAASMGKPADGTIHFSVSLLFLTWLTGYISTWFVVKKRNAWVAVLLGTVIILINLSNLPASYHRFFFFHILASLLLIGMVSLARSHPQSENTSIIHSARGSVIFMISLFCFSGIVASTAWFVPEIRNQQLENSVNVWTLWRKDVEKHLNNFFAAIPAKESSIRNDEQTELLFGDPFGVSDELHFVVTSQQPFYSRTRMYDSYNSRGWTSSDSMQYTFRQGIITSGSEELSKTSRITYTVSPRLRTDLVLTAGEFISSNIPVLVRTLSPMRFKIDLTQPGGEDELPADVASLAYSLRNLNAENRLGGSNELSQLLPKDLILTGINVSRYFSEEYEHSPHLVPDGSTPDVIEVMRVSPGVMDTVTVITPSLLRSNQRYQVTTRISTATPDDLNQADSTYPSWITDYYLQLPSTLPDRVRKQSEIVTRGTRTPYEKAMAIRNYVSSRYRYSLKVKAPPEAVDGVDYFLFEEKSGNCVHFASAMAVMLRSVGVPTRVCAGYAPGEYHDNIGGFVLSSKQLHAWPEVYFPGYGWIEFEPTPSADEEPRTTTGGLTGFSDWPWWLGTDEDFEAWVEWLKWLKNLSEDERKEYLEQVGLGEKEWAEMEEWLEQLEQTGYVFEETATAGGAGTTVIRNQSGRAFFLAAAAAILAYILWLYFHQRSRRSRNIDYASEAYRKLCFLASLAKLNCKLQETPLEYGARLASVFPRQAEALDFIIQTYVKRQYSPNKRIDHWQRWKLRESWRKIYPALLRRLLHIRQ